MPRSEEILSGLTRIAHDAFALAVLWHLLIATVLLAFVRGWRPSARGVAAALSAPLVTVSALALTHGNPFNGAVFAALAVTLTALTQRLPRAPVGRGDAPSATVGAAMLAYAWCYPHFLSDRSALAYLVGAPVGLVPCPTLSLLLGVALATGLYEARAWARVLSAAGLFYGLIGVARLHVWLDVGLLLGASALLARTLTSRGDVHARVAHP